MEKITKRFKDIQKIGSLYFKIEGECTFIKILGFKFKKKSLVTINILNEEEKIIFEEKFLKEGLVLEDNSYLVGNLLIDPEDYIIEKMRGN